MIKFSETQKNTIVASALATGDKFVKVTYFQYNAGVQSIKPYTVEKVLKRDIVCKTSKGEELRLSVNNNVDQCYLPDSPFLAELRKELKFKNRCKAAYELMSVHLIKNQADEELLAAIEAYGERVKAKQQG